MSGLHRDDEDFEVMNAEYPSFPDLPQQTDESIDVNLGDLCLTPPDISRVKTRPMTQEEMGTNLEMAFGTAKIISRKVDEAPIVEILDEVALSSLLNEARWRVDFSK